MATLKDLINRLEPNYKYEALLFTSFLYGSDLSHVLAHLDDEVPRSKIKSLRQAFSKLAKDYPLAYLIKQKHFYNYLFYISPEVLIPRPESETIIDLGVNYAQWTKKPLKILDIGTGSGALIITLAKEIKKYDRLLYQKSVFLAGDISQAALKVAKNNAHRLRVGSKINFIHSDLAQAFLVDLKKDKNQPLFICANLPYLNTIERKKELSIKYEPDLALLGGGDDGLLLYKKLLTQLSRVLVYRKYYLVMEINPHQTKVLIMLVRKFLPNAKIQKKPDLSGRTRFIVAFSTN